MPHDGDGDNNPDPSSSELELPKKNTGGRPLGRRNKENIKLQERVQRHGRVIFGRLLHWVRSKDGNISLAAIKLALAYGYGKPPDRVLIGNDQGKPFVVATPTMVQSQDEWDKLVRETAYDTSGDEESVGT